MTHNQFWAFGNKIYNHWQWPVTNTQERIINRIPGISFVTWAGLAVDLG